CAIAHGSSDSSESGLRLGGDEPHGSAEADAVSFFVVVDEFGAHRSEHVVSRTRVDVTEETPRHWIVEDEVDRLLEGAATSDDESGGERVALDLREAGGAEQGSDLVGIAKCEHARSAGQPAERGQL